MTQSSSKSQRSEMSRASAAPAGRAGRSGRRARWASVLGLAAAGAAAATVAVALAPHARAEVPAAAKPGEAAKAGDMKPFTQEVSASEAGAAPIKFDLVPIPGGTVKLGSPDAEKKRKPDEGPQHEVKVEPFYMGATEVTWDIFNEYLNQYNLLGQMKTAPVPVEKQADAVSYPTPIYDIEAGPALQRMGGRQGKFPAAIMSHYSAKQFTKWLSAKTGRFYRLPTEAEWEFAARGGKDTAYFFGDDPKGLKDYAWYEDNSNLADGDPGYHEVGKKKPNPYGLFDIYGNVAEIVIDQYDADFYKALAGKGGAVADRDAVRWPDTQYPRIVRGGGYESDAASCRSAARQKVTVAFNTKDPQSPKSPYWWTEGFSAGFRVISPVAEASAEEKAKYWEPDNDSVRDVLKRDREARQLTKDIEANEAKRKAK